MKTTTTNLRKIVFFIPSFPVLTETFIEREVVKLVERGKVEVKVVSITGDCKKLPEVLKNKVIYQRINIFHIIWGLMFLITGFSKVREAFGVTSQKRKPLIARLYQLLKSLGYAKIFQSQKPDFIFAHFMSEPSTIAMLVSAIIEVPFGISAHAKDITVNSEYVSEKINKAKFILVCNKHALEHLMAINNHRVAHNVYLQYHGIDFETLQQTDPATVEKSAKPLVLTVARLVEKKGHKFLIEASAILKKRGVEHQVFIIGPGPLYSELQAYIKEQAVEDCVQILGGGEGLLFNQIKAYYKIAQVLVFSGITTEEGDEDGVPNMLVEGAAFKLPIVSTDSGSTADLIENEITGLVVPQRNSYLLADMIEKIIFNKDLADKLSRNAYAKVKEMFDLNKNIIEIERLIS